MTTRWTCAPAAALIALMLAGCERAGDADVTAGAVSSTGSASTSSSTSSSTSTATEPATEPGAGVSREAPDARGPETRPDEGPPPDRIPRELIELNKIADVRRLIERGVDVNATYGDDGARGVHIAAALHASDVLQLLLENGADANATMRYGETPLMKTAMNDRADMAEILIAHGADPDQRNVSGETALFFAACVGAEQTAAVLLEHGASVNVASAGSETPLHWAAEFGQLEMVQFLLDSGADPSRRNRAGHRAVDQAEWARHDEIADLLRSGQAAGRGQVGRRITAGGRGTKDPSDPTTAVPDGGR